MAKTLEISGQKFGRLTVTERVENNRHGQSQWKCVCDCGNVVIANGHKLVSGHTQSCGCYQKDAARFSNKKHGDSDHRLYDCWSKMKGRCSNPNDKSYIHYGGRGIQVCDEWNRYESFRNWALSHGYRDDLTIDRIDVNGNYCPENCRWATKSEQANNKRSNRFVEYCGEVHTIAEWASKLDMSYDALQLRLSRNWTIEKAFNTPVRNNGRCVESKV